MAAFVSLPTAFLLLGSSQPLWFSLGVMLLGVAHAVITVKGTHLASHRALSESQVWGKFWIIFFIEVCSSFSAEAGVHGHIKMHHAHTNVIGLGDSSIWKVSLLPRIIYLFIAPLTLPVITPLVAFAHLKGRALVLVIRTVLMVGLGLYSQLWLLINVSGFRSMHSALFCMLACRAMFSVPYIHVNIFQVKPVVSKFLTDKKLPYQEDAYLSRLYLFFHKYQELMVLAPPITELVGVQ